MVAATLDLSAWNTAERPLALSDDASAAKRVTYVIPMKPVIVCFVLSALLTALALATS